MSRGSFEIAKRESGIQAFPIRLVGNSCEARVRLSFLECPSRIFLNIFLLHSYQVRCVGASLLSNLLCSGQLNPDKQGARSSAEGLVLGTNKYNFSNRTRIDKRPRCNALSSPHDSP